MSTEPSDRQTDWFKPGPKYRSVMTALESPASHRTRAYIVHLYTALGVAIAFFAAAQICSPYPDVPLIFRLFIAAVFVDSTDGTLARRWNVKRWAPGIDGRTIDDIVDYLTYTFLPLLLMWRMGWLPSPAAIWIVPAMIASLFGFANCEAKDESDGFFLGFPSYWNFIAFYAGLWTIREGLWINAALVVLCALLTILPVRFLYPNLAPKEWRRSVLVGAILWVVLIFFMLFDYPLIPLWLIALSLVYPGYYVILSLKLNRGVKKKR